MQKIAFKKLLAICIILIIPSTGCAAQQTWLGCDFANIMAGVTVAGVVSRTAYVASCYAVAPHNITYSYEPSNGRRYLPHYASDLVKNGFYPALGVGAFTAIAACSGSWHPVEMKDAIKPAAFAFGALLLAKIPCIYFGAKCGDGFTKYNGITRNQVLELDRSYLGDYATAVITVGVPLYVLYQRYNQS